MASSRVIMNTSVLKVRVLLIGASGILGREDLNRDDLGLLRAYYEESFGFPYLLDLGGTIRCTTDLGDLW